MNSLKKIKKKFPIFKENLKKLKIIEYMKNYYNKNKNSNSFKNKIINLNCRDRYILFKIYEFLKENNFDINKSCYLQKHNITYFNENKERYIKYYEMIKNSNRNINNVNELLFLGNNHFNIKFCSKKKYLNNSLTIQRGVFIVSFE